MERGDSLIYKSGSFGIYMYATVSQQKAVAAVSRGSNKILYDTRGCAAARLTPRYVLSPRLHGALEFRSPSVRHIALQIGVWRVIPAEGGEPYFEPALARVTYFSMGRKPHVNR